MPIAIAALIGLLYVVVITGVPDHTGVVSLVAIVITALVIAGSAMTYSRQGGRCIHSVSRISRRHLGAVRDRHDSRNNARPGIARARSRDRRAARRHNCGRRAFTANVRPVVPEEG